MSQIIIDRAKLKDTPIDINDRDIVIGFSEPAFRYDFSDGKFGALLNARLLSYFLPAVEIASKEKIGRRPRLVIVSGVKAAIKWNAQNDEERKAMLINNNLKKDFLSVAFNKFFPDVFSIVEIRDTIDFLKISDSILQEIWLAISEKFSDKVLEIENHLKRFGNGSDKNGFFYRYALMHLFALGDVNFDWEPHSANGYCSIGEHNESVFNEVREMALSLMKEKVTQNKSDFYIFENLKIVIADKEKAPPPYNGAHRSSHGNTELDEVTFENERQISYYEKRPRLQPSMEYLYSFIPREKYEQFWNEYKERYFDLKKRYYEAYNCK